MMIKGLSEALFALSSNEELTNSDDCEVGVQFVNDDTKSRVN